MIQHSEINGGSEPKTCPCVQRNMINLTAEEWGGATLIIEKKFFGFVILIIVGSIPMLYRPRVLLSIFAKGNIDPLIQGKVFVD